jgi:hypothetical protein
MTGFFQEQRVINGAENIDIGMEEAPRRLKRHC